MKKYFFRYISPKDQSYHHQYTGSWDLRDEFGSIWSDKEFFVRLDKILNKWFRGIHEAMSHDYFKFEVKKQTIDPLKFSQFLKARKKALSVLEGDRYKKKYIFILQLLLISLATRYLLLIENQEIARTIFTDTQALCRSLCKDFGTEITLNQRKLFKKSHLQFSFPAEIDLNRMVKKNRAAARAASVRCPAADDTDQLSEMSIDWSESDKLASLPITTQQQASTSVAICESNEDPVRDGSFICSDWPVQMPVIHIPSFFSPSACRPERSIEEKTELLGEILGLIQKIALELQPSLTHSRHLQESLPKDSFLKIAKRIVQNGLTLDKEGKVQLDKLDKAIEQLQHTFKAEDLEESCPDMNKMYTLLGIKSNSSQLKT